jgi:uncharacterized protein (DUF1778 family)
MSQKGNGRTKAAPVQVYFEAGEKQRLRDAANAKYQTLSEFVRQAATHAADKVLGKPAAK